MTYQHRDDEHTIDTTTMISRDDILNEVKSLEEYKQPRTGIKTKPNPNNIYLKDCWSFSSMKDDLPPYFVVNLDDILTGVSNLDLGGNTRPVSKRLLFNMLRDLDEISTQTIKGYTNYSESYCRKLAGLMRVTVQSFNRLVDS